MRRPRDEYFTPEWATDVLLDRHAMKGDSVFECCVGDGAIARVLEKRFRYRVWMNDIISTGVMGQKWIRDASAESNWCDWRNFDWVITNPPFSLAPQIVPLAYKHAQIGIAMLLRLSYLEPVENRGAWLNEHPPTKLIVLPRISFTGDGKTDSVCTAWMVWEKVPAQQSIIIAENPRFTKLEVGQRLFKTA